MNDDLQLPADFIDFQSHNRRVMQTPAKCEAGKITLKPLKQLELREFTAQTWGTPHEAAELLSPMVGDSCVQARSSRLFPRFAPAYHRMVRSGSTRAAERAGISAAMRATSRSTIAAPPYVSGSVGAMLKRSEPSSRLEAMAPKRPSASPSSST